MNKIKKEEMDLRQISKEIVSEIQFREKFIDANLESLADFVEKIIKEQIINILDPENVYEKGKYYDELGYYIGIVDEYPNGADYFIKNHCFRIPTQGSGIPSKINKVLIREIKK
jgi:hypothetical protein